MFLGYPEDCCGWKLWDPRAKQAIISCDVIWNKEKMPGKSTAPVLLLSVLEYLDQDEDTEPSNSNPAEPLDAPQERAHIKQPARTQVPPVEPPGKDKTKDDADLPRRPAMPVRVPHLFFNLKSPTPAPQTPPPPQSPEMPPLHPRCTPAHRNPLPTPDPAPDAPCRYKGVVLAPNFWNATDYGMHIESYCKLSLCHLLCTPSAHPSASPTPDPAAWQELSVPILSNQEEEAAALP
jgi:hypothetical protein